MSDMRLRYGAPTWIVARDPERQLVLVGGLGVLGVGEMWFKEEPRDRERQGYVEAEIRQGSLLLPSND